MVNYMPLLYKQPMHASWMIEKLEKDGLLEWFMVFTFNIYSQIHVPKKINLISLQV